MKRKIEAILEAIKAQFGTQQFTVSKLYSLFKELDSATSLSTVRWRLSTLKSEGKIEAMARGVYRLSLRDQFHMQLPPELIKISKEIKNHFPYSNFCCWSSDILNEFMIHQPSVSFMIVEVDKDALEGVFSFLQTCHDNVFLNPKKKEIEHYLLAKEKSLVVKPLINRSPIKVDSQKIYPVPKLEKILVDIVSAPELFFLHQGSELDNIWKEAFRKYAINTSALSNYARRRHSFDVVQNIMKKMNLLN